MSLKFRLAIFHDFSLARILYACDCCVSHQGIPPEWQSSKSWGIVKLICPGHVTSVHQDGVGAVDPLFLNLGVINPWERTLVPIESEAGWGPLEKSLILCLCQELKQDTLDIHSTSWSLTILSWVTCTELA